MAGQSTSPIKLKTETEHLLYNHYREEKAEREKLQHVVKSLEQQIEFLQKELSNLMEQTKVQTQAPYQNITEEIPSQQRVEYNTDEEELAKETEWIRCKSRKKRKLNTSATQNQLEIDNTPEKVIEKIRKIPPPPPIIVDGIKNYQTFYDFLSGNQLSDSFVIKMMSGESVKINANDEDSYRAITKILGDNSYLWHSYENKQERPIRVMAKKIHHTYDPSRIVDDLKNKGFKITEAVNKLRWKNKEPLDMFMLTFEKDEDLNKIYNIKSILGCKVDIHPIRTTKLVPQCKRCQAYGHTQGYCSKQPRCVKCTGKHLTRDCQKPAEEKPKCVHCGAPHPANYRGCIVAKEIQTMRNKQTKKPTLTQQKKALVEKQNKQQSNVAQPAIQKTTSKQISYAQAASSKSTHTKSQSSENKLDEIINFLSSLDQRLKKLEANTQRTQK